MKTFKKYLAAVLALLMVTTACPATVLADTVYTNTDAGAVNDYCTWSYTAEDKTLYINKDGVLTGNADKKLPLYFEDGSYWSYTGWSRLVFGKDITKIEELEVFADKGAATPVDIEFEDGSVCSELGDNVFKFGNASSFKFPENLEVIGTACFCGLFKERNHTSITIPSGVKSIGDEAFIQCGLDTVTIPDYTGEGVRVFGNALFEDTSINNITMGTGNTEIPDDCFNRSDLVSFTVPEGITRIGYRAFQYCENLVRVTFPDSIENIDNTSFQQTSINSVVIPDNGKAIRIGNYTFEDCKNLASVTFPNSLETTVELGDNSFRNCTSLVNLTITASVRKMGSNVFQHTYKLKNLTFKAIKTDEGYVGLDTVGFGAFESSTVKNVTFCESITTLDSYSFNSCVNIEEIELPESIKSIKWNVFSYTGIKELEMPENVTLLSSSAFAGCKKLEKVDLSKATELKAIGSSAFGGDPVLEYIKLPEGLTKIENNAFNGCASLESIDIPKGVTFIGSAAFANSGIRDILLPTGLATLDFEAFLGTPISVADLSKCTKLKVIGNSTFKDCSNLKTVILPSTITKIGTCAFQNSALKNIKMKSVGLIGENAFRNTMLEKIIIPDNCYEIDKYAFYDIPSLKYIQLPASLKTLQTNIFNGANVETLINKNTTISSTVLLKAFCNSVNSGATIMGYTGSPTQELAASQKASFVPLDGVADETPEYAKSGTCGDGKWSVTETENSVTLTIEANGAVESNMLTDTENNTFTAAELVEAFNVTKVIFEDGITSIPDNMLYLDGTSTNSVKEIKLPTSLEKIGANAFRNMQGLEKAEIPVFVNEIGEYAFAYCTSLDVKLNPVLPLTEIKEGTFYSTAFTDVTVPLKVITIGKRAFGNNMSDGGEVRLYLAGAVSDIYKNTSNPADNALGYFADGSKDERTVIAINYECPAYDYANLNGFEWTYGCGLDMQNGYFKSSDSNVLWQYDKESKCIIVDATANPVMVGNNFCYSNGEPVKNRQLEVYAVILDGATSISSRGRGVFAVFNPKYIYLPDTLEKIGEYAFNNCTELRAIEIPDSVTSMDVYSFSATEKLSSIKFGRGMTVIPERLFNSHPALKYVEFPDNLTAIGEKSFYRCKMLQEIIIPDSVRTVYDSAFYGCTMVQRLVIGSGISSMGYGAFGLLRSCNDVECRYNSNSTYSGNSRNAGHYVFHGIGYDTTGITLKFNSSYRARFCDFAYQNVKEVYLGEKVSVIDNGPIPSHSDYVRLEAEHFIVDGNNKNYYSYNDCLYTADDVLLRVPTNATSVKIKDGTTALADYAFNCSGVHTVSMPDSVQSIGKYCFYECEDLRKVTLSASLTAIPDAAFAGCTNLRTIELPSGVKSIGYGAFGTCNSLASVILNDELESIDRNAFVNCWKLECIVIPRSVESIGNNAFAYMSSLKDIYIWDTQLNADESAINNCDPDLTIHTLLATSAYEYARTKGIKLDAYTDEDAFFDDCEMMKDIYLGYFGICEYGHGDIQYLTVYEADCTMDGYIIGVCEYCSVVLEEIHINASGHDYQLKANIPATDVTRGMLVYTCNGCGNTYREYTEPAEDESATGTYTVTGSVVLAENTAANSGSIPVGNVSVLIDGTEVARTSQDGTYSFEAETGVYELVLKYAYGFERSIYVVVNKDVNIEPVPVIACDFNKDGNIDDNDIYLFRIVISSGVNDASYLDFVDLNKDGRIDVRDAIYINRVKGISKETYQYPNIVVIP